jgi:hypothetical protein
MLSRANPQFTQYNTLFVFARYTPLADFADNQRNIRGSGDGLDLLIRMYTTYFPLVSEYYGRGCGHGIGLQGPMLSSMTARLPVLVVPGQRKPLDEIERRDQSDAEHGQNENRSKHARRVE